MITKMACFIALVFINQGYCESYFQIPKKYVDLIENLDSVDSYRINAFSLKNGNKNKLKVSSDYRINISEFDDGGNKFYISISRIGLEIESRDIFIIEITTENDRKLIGQIDHAENVIFLVEENLIHEFDKIYRYQNGFLAELVNVNSRTGLKESVYLFMTPNKNGTYVDTISIIPAGVYTLNVYVRTDDQFASLRSKPTGLLVTITSKTKKVNAVSENVGEGEP